MKATINLTTNSITPPDNDRLIQNQEGVQFLYLYGVPSGFRIQATFTRADGKKVGPIEALYDLDPENQYCYVCSIPSPATQVAKGLGISIAVYEPKGTNPETFKIHTQAAIAVYVYENDSIIIPEDLETEIANAFALAISNTGGQVNDIRGFVIGAFGYQAGIVTGAPFLNFKTNANEAPMVGRFVWDAVEGTAAFLEKTGSKHLVGRGVTIIVTNKETAPQPAGTIMYLENEQTEPEANTRAYLASNANSSAYKTLVVLKQTINPNGIGAATLVGLTNLDIGHAFTPGQKVYLATNGMMTATRPTAPAAVVQLGTVLGQNRLLFYPVAAPTMEGLSDTLQPAQKNHGDIWMYNENTQRFELRPKSDIAANIIVLETQPEGQERGDFWYDTSD